MYLHNIYIYIFVLRPAGVWPKGDFATCRILLSDPSSKESFCQTQVVKNPAAKPL